MKYVVVTGASTGIGFSTTDYLIQKGYHVFGSVRKQSDAHRLKESFDKLFTPLIFDVTDHKAIAEAKAIVAAQIGAENLVALVNNAGIAVSGPLQYLPMEDLRFQFEVNVFGQIAVIQEFLPLLGAIEGNSKKVGKIINISSISGKITAPLLAAYAASKHAFESLSDGLRRELALFGIDVVILEPGPIKTPIWQKALQADNKYANTPYRDFVNGVVQYVEASKQDAIDPIQVAKVTLGVIEGRKKRVRYVIAKNRWLYKFIFNLPDRLLDRAMINRLKNRTS